MPSTLPKSARRAAAKPLLQPDLFGFAFPIRVYFESTDAGGVVYHGEYLKFLERARTEWLRKLGFTHQALARKHGVVFVASGIAADFVRPAKLDDSLAVGVQVEQVGKVRVIFHQEIRNDVDDVLVRARVTIACVSVDGFKPVPIPAELAKKLEAAT
ncbi:MAG: tol-pal system-associated acyl-CoA thioesterase [Betaproteobacteria bacterium]|nr:tol-pal system-associated acyl-CoA thioesterase [Betaproteobacteria bacterium]